MPAGSEVRYEVHVCDGGRWTIYTDAATKGKAIQEATALLASGKFDAAKVTEDRGQSKEILVWQEEANRVEKAESIVPIEDFPALSKTEDFYKFDARLAFGRLLRQYLDKRSLTALELLHDSSRLRELKRRDEIYFQMLQCIGAILARNTDKKPAEMIDVLENYIRQMTMRAEKWTNGGVAAVEAEDAGYPARAEMATLLGESRDWEGKLLSLIEILEKGETKNLPLIDEAAAEVLDSPEGVRDLLGFQRNLAVALQTMVRISAGTYRLGEGSNSTLERLSRLMAAHQMKHAQTVLMERVARALSGFGALTKGDRRDEQDAFRELMRHIVGAKMFTNSGALAEAATLRAKSVLKDEFADESSEKAIDDMIVLLPTVASKIGYLLDLCGTDFGTKNQMHVISCLASVLTSIMTVTQIVEKGASDEAIVRAAAGLRDRLLAAGLPQEWRQRFAKRIYDLLITYKQGGPGATVAAANFDIPGAKKPEAAAANEVKKPGTYATGEVIFNEGEKGDTAYVVVSGTVDIIKRAGDRDIVLAQVGQGSIIGEMALIDDHPRMATARSATDVVVKAIPRAEIVKRLQRLEEFDPVLRRLMGMFVQRMRAIPFMSGE